MATDCDFVPRTEDFVDPVPPLGKPVMVGTATLGTPTLGTATLGRETPGTPTDADADADELADGFGVGGADETVRVLELVVSDGAVDPATEELADFETPALQAAVSKAAPSSAHPQAAGKRLTCMMTTRWCED